MLLFAKSLYIPSFKKSVGLVLAIIGCYWPQRLPAKSSRTAIHYGWEQGLTAATIYALHVDHLGYLWIGTENGMFRFNGKEFQVYTTRDGLPDNEILGFHETPDGRVWMTPFASKLCFMQNGKLYTPTNTPWLKRMHLRSNCEYIRMDSFGNTWVNGGNMLIRIDKQNKVHYFTPETGTHFRDNEPMCWFDYSGCLLMSMNDGTYILQDTVFKRIGSAPFERGCPFFGYGKKLFNWASGAIVDYTLDDSGIHYGRVRYVPGLKGRRVLPACAVVEANFTLLRSRNTIYKIDFKQAQITDSFFIGVQPGCVLPTKDGGLWVGTVGKGLIRFAPSPVHTLSGDSATGAITWVKGLAGDSVYALSMQPCFLEGVPGKDVIRLHRNRLNIPHLTHSFPYWYAAPNKQGKWIVCGDNLRLMSHPAGAMLKNIRIMAKAVIEEDNTHLLIASHTGVYRLDKERFVITDTLLYPRRAIALAKQDSIVFVGTLNGLLAIDPGRKQLPLPDTALLQARTMALCTTGNGILWVANSKAELIGLRQNKIVHVLGQKEGLRCNNISCMKASGSLLWIGTDKGLFAISQTPPYRIVRHINYISGLSNDQVNCLDIVNGRIWVGTISGVNYFEENEAFGQLERSKLVINSIRNGWRDLEPAKIMKLDYRTLSVDFDEIDFSGNLRSVFQYQISPDSTWVNLENSYLYFPSLDYGPFTLKIRLMGPDGMPGAQWEQTFDYPPPFYLSWWFRLLWVLLALAIAGWSIFYLYLRARRRDRERLAVQQNLLMLEQMALQAQMNPHFIFNCIATVKYYYNAGDTEQGNRFVDLFTTLIRQTFEMGNSVFVPLDKELEYLRQYLDVEQARFHDSFSFGIECRTINPVGSIPVPTMLLQPVVENAVRHGVRHLPDGQGVIRILISEAKGIVTFVISDNGIGIHKSKAMKSGVYHGALTSSVVNEKRIDILNRLFGGQIRLHAEDLGDLEPGASGTRITITYPITINQTNT